MIHNKPGIGLLYTVMWFSVWMYTFENWILIPESISFGICIYLAYKRN